MTSADRRGLVSGPNPARGVEKHRGEAKDRTLNPDELARLGAALREQEPLHPMATAAVRLMALTGLRREEACGLRWREIDFATSCLRLQATKTGRSLRPIGRAALNLLSTLPRNESEFVFPSTSEPRAPTLKSVSPACLTRPDWPMRARTIFAGPSRASPPTKAIPTRRLESF